MLNISKLNHSFYKLANRSSQRLYQTSTLIHLNQVNTCQTSPSRSIASNKKYTNNPPIDLNRVRTRSLESETDEDPKKPNYGFILLVIPLFTFGLGVWQLRRREWKVNLINFLNERTSTEPRELPTDTQELENLSETCEFYPYKVKGRFIHSKEILLSPRHDITGQSTLPGGLIITPFEVADRNGLTILVNRGYVPYTDYSPTKRQEGQVEGQVELVGLLRKDEIISAFTPVNKPPNEWHHREINLMAKTLGTVPILIDAIQASTVKGGPLGGQTAINLRNEHMSYVITWWTLTFFTSLLWWNKFGRLLFVKR